MDDYVKKYYHALFGPFTNLTATEINEINNREFALLDLRGILYLKSGVDPNIQSPVITKPLLRGKLGRLLAFAKN